MKKTIITGDIESWTNNVKDWTLITKESMDLMLKECELALNETIQSIESTTSRADKLISIYIPITVLLIGFSLPHYKEIFSKYLVTCSFVCLLVLLFGIICCWQNIKCYNHFGNGFLPSEIIRTEHIDNNYTEKEQYINFALAICTSIQTKININRRIFSKRSKYNQLALYCLCFLPISPILVFLFAMLLGFPLCYF